MVNVTSCLCALWRGGSYRAVGAFIPKPPTCPHSMAPKPQSDTTHLYLEYLNCPSSALQLDRTFLEGRNCILTFFCVSPIGEPSTTQGMWPEICPYPLNSFTEVPLERPMLHLAWGVCPGPPYLLADNQIPCFSPWLSQAVLSLL